MTAMRTLAAIALFLLPAATALAAPGQADRTDVAPRELAAKDVAPPNPFEAAYAKVAPGVVRVVNGPKHASGLLLSEDGLIVTHKSIVTRNVLTVYLPDGRRAEAKALLRDKDTDLAVLQIVPAGAKDKPAEGPAAPAAPPAPVTPLSNVKWPQATLGSGDVKAGAWMATVAYPVGTDSKAAHAPSLSAGLLSARGKIPTKLAYKGDLLLTDAMVNAGSEGGALIDMQGRVVGILCLPQFHKETGTALNVALPVEVVPPLLKRARETPDPPIAEDEFAGRKNGFLGVIKAPGSETCLVGDVTTGGPAEKAGIKPGDTIVQVGDKPVASFDDLVALLKDTKPGDKIKLTVKRPGSEKPLEIEVELAKYPEKE